MGQSGILFRVKTVKEDPPVREAKVNKNKTIKRSDFLVDLDFSGFYGNVADLRS